MDNQPRCELIVLNFALDSNNPLLSHQADVVKALAQKFHNVSVITGNLGNFDRPYNVRVIDLKWVEGNNIRNVFRLYKSFLSILKPGKTVVFSHMADVQSAFLSPLTWIMGNTHYLWYAHKHLSPYLKFASFFVSEVLTSTSGSCPLSGEKVRVIGQGVNPEIFKSRSKIFNPLEKCVHIGRADPSKNLEILFGFAALQFASNPRFKLIQIGDPSTNPAKQKFDKLCEKHETFISSGVIELHSSMPRNQVPEVLAKADFFVHAYKGSLDKTLIESTFARLPVVTLNREYHQIFGKWGGQENPTLKSEFEALKTLSNTSLEQELERRFRIAEESHSFTKWIQKITDILQKI